MVPAETSRRRGLSFSGWKVVSLGPEEGHRYFFRLWGVKERVYILAICSFCSCLLTLHTPPPHADSEVYLHSQLAFSCGGTFRSLSSHTSLGTPDCLTNKLGPSPKYHNFRIWNLSPTYFFVLWSL